MNILCLQKIQILLKFNQITPKNNLINPLPNTIHITRIGLLLFDKIIKEDPVVKKSIGSGLDWYEINKEGLPEVSFECADMRDCLKSDDEAQNVVYVMANSAAYVFQNNPNDFIKLFQQIRENNEGKNVFVALGDIENMLLNTNRLGIPFRTQLALNGIIDSLGFKHVSPYKLRQLGILADETTSNKLYKLNN